MYLLRVPKLLRKTFPAALWEMPNDDSYPAVYLTFDDGPHPSSTSFILEQLAKYKAEATFFCIGKNVVEYPAFFDRIIEAGHTIGNHTHNHLKGGKTSHKTYIENVQNASQFIPGNLFRPPYGSIKRVQAKALKDLGYHLVMWSLLSGDFDEGISPKKCLENVVLFLKPGDIVVFHDSEKAFPRMSYALPRVLEHCKNKKWTVKRL